MVVLVEMELELLRVVQHHQTKEDLEGLRLVEKLM
jgi:hypothetical protein